jgi:hypothetical protein
VAGDGLHQLRHLGARPGPLAQLRERALVDLDDGDRRAAPLAREEALVGIEAVFAQRPDARGRRGNEREEKNDQGDRGGARAAQRSISRPS